MHLLEDQPGTDGSGIRMAHGALSQTFGASEFCHILLCIFHALSRRRFSRRKHLLKGSAAVGLHRLHRGLQRIHHGLVAQLRMSDILNRLQPRRHQLCQIGRRDPFSRFMLRGIAGKQ
ncbi:hypothetical protein SDC9_62073 [bioreactor metagenome]|uniref:Uncharacterized protein n=1 Tax=bioreactor metagenome TaxID=1076179 RepID=A0A644XHL0_9ZZZZ